MAISRYKYKEIAGQQESSLVPLIGLITLVLAIMACASAPTPGLVPSDSTTTTEPSLEPGPSIFEELLGLVPDTPETRARVRIVDHSRLGEALDLPLQPDDSGTDETEFFSMQRTFLSFHEVISMTQSNLREGLALSPEMVDQSLLAGAGPQQWEALRGRFNPDSTEQALSACSGECIPPDVREEYQGVTFYSWGYAFGIPNGGSARNERRCRAAPGG